MKWSSCGSMRNAHPYALALSSLFLTAVTYTNLIRIDPGSTSSQTRQKPRQSAARVRISTFSPTRRHLPLLPRGGGCGKRSSGGGGSANSDRLQRRTQQPHPRFRMSRTGSSQRLFTCATTSTAGPGLQATSAVKSGCRQEERAMPRRQHARLRRLRSPWSRRKVSWRL